LLFQRISTAHVCNTGREECDEPGVGDSRRKGASDDDPDVKRLARAHVLRKPFGPYSDGIAGKNLRGRQECGRKMSVLAITF